MKIFFEDGKLLDKDLLGFDCQFYIEAGDGYSFCEGALEIVRENFPSAVVYTNFLPALNNKYAWNDDLSVPEIYMRYEKDQKFYRIDKLTQRELRKAHNIMKLYMNFEFRELVNEES